MNTEQQRALLDAAISWLESCAGVHLRYEPTFNGSWRYIDANQTQGYNGRWHQDSHGNTRLQLTWHTFKHGGESERFDDFAVIQSLRTGSQRPRYQARKLAPKRTAPKKDTTKYDLNIWQHMPKHGASPYLQRKQIADVKCDTIRYNRRGDISLLIQGFTDDGALESRGVQTIAPNGDKLYSAGLNKRGAFIAVSNEGVWGDVLYVAEGFATAASVRAAKHGANAIACLDAGNLQHVVRELKKHRPNTEIIVCADNDAFDKDGTPRPPERNAGQTAAHLAALSHRCHVTSPEPEHGITDFNDLHTKYGLDAVRDALEVVKRPNVAIAFAKDKAKAMKRLQGSGATFGRYLPTITQLQRGVTVIRSPQGTGKTFAMKALIDEYQAQGLRVLYLTHRVSLAKDAARRLNLQHYEDVAGDYIRAVGSLAMCVNSLPRLRDGNGVLTAFDVVIIDESEQLARALAGKHIANKKGVLTALADVIAGADRLACLDADAGLLTARMLQHYRPNSNTRYITHHHEVGAARTLQIADDRADLFVAMAECKQPAFIVTNSKTESERVHVWLESRGKQGVMINGESGESDFATNIDKHARVRRLDYVVCSPSVNTGVSLESGYFTHVFGIFHSTVGTPADALQALWRVRTPAQYHVWLDTRVVSEHVDLTARYNATITHEERLLAQAVGVRDTAYEDIRRVSESVERQAQAAFRLDFLRLANRQGFGVTLQAASKQYPKLLERVKDMWLAWKHGQIEKAERYEPTRAAIREFYRLQDSEPIRPWIEYDNFGKQRKGLGKLERALGDVDAARLAAREFISDSSMAADATLHMSEREFIRQVLQAVRFVESAKLCTGSESPEQANLPRYDAASLAPLLQWIESNRSWLAGLVALPSPDKLAANPLRYVASWLKRCGLKQVRSGKRERSQYSLCLESLSTTCDVLQRRGVTLLLDKDIQEKVSPPPPKPLNQAGAGILQAYEHARDALKALKLKQQTLKTFESIYQAGDANRLQWIVSQAPDDVRAAFAL